MPMETLGKQMILCIMFGSVIGARIFLMNGLTRKTVGSVIMAGGVLASNFLTQIDLLYGTDYAFIFFFKWMNLNEYLTGRYDFGENLL